MPSAQANNKMGCNMKVEIQSKKWVKPATPTPPHLHKLMLSSIDQLVPPMFVRLIMHFDIGKLDDTEVVATIPERLTRLEESLSKVLTLYYPFAGGYYRDELAVSCQDQGVEFVVATVDRKLNELADGDCDKKDLVNSLGRSDVAWTPVVSVQVNVFTCGRFAIGLSFLHKVLDMYTFSTFMDAWATASRLGTLNQVVRPSFSLSSFLPPNHNQTAPPSKTNNKPQPAPRIFVSKRYVFTEDTISKLKSSAISNNNNASELNYTNKYTRLELVMAVITRNLINIEYSKGAPLRPLLISQPMNLRTRVKLPIEENSCGNLCIKIMAAQDVENQSWKLRQIADLIHNSVRNVISEIEKIEEWNELSDRVVKSVMDYYEETMKGDDEVNLVRFSSWCRFGLYDVDFGWGRPSLVTTVPSPLVITHLMDHKGDGGGIEAWVCLDEDDMARFEQEMNILTYASY